MKPSLDTPLSNDEMDELDAVLLTAGLDAPMDISMLDGFLCAVHSGPRRLAPSDWMPWVWDYEAAEQVPQFQNPKGEKHVAALVLRFAREVEQNLELSPTTFEPLFPERETDAGSEYVIDDWCFGFLKGIALDLPGWQPLLDLHHEWFEIFTLYGTEEGWARLEGEIEQRADADARHAEAVAAVAPALREINGFWRDARGRQNADLLPVAPPSQAPGKQARNEPCACGSGKKYKHCHGAPA